MCALCPIRIPGRPGTLTPDTCSPGARSATSYQIDGSVCSRCGSPASSAPPFATCGPLAAHALLSGAVCSWPAGSAAVCARIAPAACAVLADTVLAGTVLADAVLADAVLADTGAADT